MSDEKEMKDLALLEAYLSGELSPEEKKSVEDRLQSDESFINLLETIKHLGTAARYSHLSRKRDELLDIEERIKEEHKIEDAATSKGAASRRIRPWWVGAAASILLLVGVIWWMGRPTAEERAFMEQFEVYPMVDIVRGEVSQEERIQEAYLAYANENFRRAVKLFERLGRVEDENYYLYYGCALIKVGRIEEGKEIFEQMVEKWGDERGVNRIRSDNGQN